MSDLEESFERTIRLQMIFQATHVWNLSEKRIASQIERLVENLQEAKAKTHLQESHRVLKKVVEALAYGEPYLKEEDPITFKDLMEGLVEVFKCVFESFMKEEHAFTPGDHKIDDLNRQFYTSLKRKRRLPHCEFVSQAYPPITVLVRMVRNCQVHQRDKPIDHITRKRSFGNVYTLSSVIILSIYAYSEILQAWLDTIEI